MNAIGIQLVGRVRSLVLLYPGARSVQCDHSSAWTYVTVGTVTDEAVFSLATLLGLGVPIERRAARDGGGSRWYLVATAERNDGLGGAAEQLTVVGPSHVEGP